MRSAGGATLRQASGLAAACLLLALGAGVPTGARAAATPAPAAAGSHLDPAAKALLVAYLGALHDRRYADAFRLLAAKERSYFRTPENFASIFLADDLRIDAFHVVGSRSGGSLGVVAVVSENIRFLDHAHQTTGSAKVMTAYGLVHAAGGWEIKDPFHPWKAFRPDGISATASGLRVIVRKVSFFTERIEVVLSFVNVGTGFVTVLPYDRTVLRDGSHVYHPLATKLQTLTDRRLYEGLRLAAGAQYTGELNFLIARTARPARLDLTVAPALRDGADLPFDVTLPSIDVPT